MDNCVFCGGAGATLQADPTAFYNQGSLEQVLACDNCIDSHLATLEKMETIGA